MARIRSIKPDFFKDEDLAELPYECRLAFAGLWTQADGEGRLRDRPKRLKVELFPYDAVEMDAILSQLHDGGFILRYVVGEEHYIQIPKFRTHQRIGGKEAMEGSEIPAPNGEAVGKQWGSSGEAVGQNGDELVAQEGKGKEGKGKDGEAPARPVFQTTPDKPGTWVNPLQPTSDELEGGRAVCETLMLAGEPTYKIAAQQVRNAAKKYQCNEQEAAQRIVTAWDELWPKPPNAFFWLKDGKWDNGREPPRKPQLSPGQKMRQQLES